MWLDLVLCGRRNRFRGGKGPFSYGQIATVMESQFQSRRSAFYFVTSISSKFQDVPHARLQQTISSNFQDALNAMLQHQVQASSRTLWLPCWDIHFKQLPRRSGCYVATSGVQASSKTVCMLRCNNHFKQLPRRFGCYFVTSVSSIFQDALAATLLRPCALTSKTVWMLHCNFRFMWLLKLSGCYNILCSATSKTRWMLRCNFRWTRGCFFLGLCPGPLNPCPQVPLNVH